MPKAVKERETVAVAELLTLSQMAKMLNCSTDLLNEVLPSWTYGQEYVDLRSPGSSRASYRLNPGKVIEWFRTPPEKRG
jgi:hypothetical protein